MKVLIQFFRKQMEKAMRAIEYREAHPKQILRREDAYPFVLLVTAVILGWGVVKTRDLEGALVLVKWVLICVFIAVTHTLGTMFLARLLWDRKHKSLRTPFYIQTKPKKMQDEFRLPEKKKGRKGETNPRLLFPEGAHRMPLPNDYVAAYDATLGKVLHADGVPLYTEDADVIRYRADLFRELYENRPQREALTRFADAYPVSISDKSFRESLGDMRARQEAVRALAKELDRLLPRSAALKTLKQYLADCSDAIGRAEEAFANLPEDLYRVQSVTLAVNLDSGGFAHEAGIVALHTEPFDDRDAMPLLRPDPERYDLTLDFNRELMNCVDRMLAESFRQLRIRMEELREAELPDDYVEDIRFAAEFTAFLCSLDRCDVRFPASDSADNGWGDADIPALLHQQCLGYRTDVPADASGHSAQALKPFGCKVLRKA